MSLHPIDEAKIKIANKGHDAYVGQVTQMTHGESLEEMQRTERIQVCVDRRNGKLLNVRGLDEEGNTIWIHNKHLDADYSSWFSIWGAIL